QILHTSVTAIPDDDELLRTVRLHQKNAGTSQVSSIKELAHRRTAAPTRYAGGSGNFGRMKFSDQSGQDMRCLQVVVVVRSIQVGRHGADEVAAILAAISLTEFNASDFRNRIPLV